MDHMQPQESRDLRDRNRELISQRLGWPDGAVDAVRKLESEHDGYLVYWADGVWPFEYGAGFYARRDNGRTYPDVLFATTPEELDAILSVDAVKYPPAWWESRS